MKIKLCYWQCLILAAAVCAAESRGQTCNEDANEIKKALSTTRDSQFVLRAAAVGGSAFVPLLRTMSRPGRPPWEVAGAAQVALARLGDQDAMEELRSEIGKNGSSAINAIKKLTMIRSEASLSVLMQYLIDHRNLSERIENLGDVSVDPLWDVVRAMIEMLEEPPYSRGYTSREQLDGWERWWKETRPPHITPISEGLTDSVSICYARLAEWGFVDGVYQLYLHLGAQSVPLLKRLARLGDKAFPVAGYKTARGAAQTLLARQGDQEEFTKIVKELDGSEYPDAVAKLQYISGPAAFEALLRSLSLQTFMLHSDREKKYIDAEGQKLRIALMQALSKMVANPPLPPDAAPTPENIQKWTTWWEANKEKNVLKNMPG